MRLARKIAVAMGLCASLLATTLVTTPGTAHATGGIWTWREFVGVERALPTGASINLMPEMPYRVQYATTYTCTATAKFRTSKPAEVMDAGLLATSNDVWVENIESFGYAWRNLSAITWHKTASSNARPGLYVFKSGLSEKAQGFVKDVTVTCDWSTIE